MKISTIEQPKIITRYQMSDQDRLSWWQKHYFLTTGVALSMGVIPIIALYRNNGWGPRIFVLFYLFLYFFTWLTRRKVYEVHGKPETKKRWWTIPLLTLFTLLKLWILYIIIIVFIRG